ncbi:tripartite tricarboxylate transporter substrate-binding protein, partial [Pseudomonas aeruginosa]
MSQQLGQNIIVENKGGASGSIGAAAVAASPADGYTFA